MAAVGTDARVSENLEMPEFECHREGSSPKNKFPALARGIFSRRWEFRLKTKFPTALTIEPTKDQPLLFFRGAGGASAPG